MHALALMLMVTGAVMSEPSYNWQAVDQVLAAAIANQSFPGCVALVATGEQEIVYHKAHGTLTYDVGKPYAQEFMCVLYMKVFVCRLVAAEFKANECFLQFRILCCCLVLLTARSSQYICAHREPRHAAGHVV